MIISDLDYMENIVSSRSDLEWDGWNVVRYIENEACFMSVDGAFRNGKWYKKQTYRVTENGWEVPNSFRKHDA